MSNAMKGWFKKRYVTSLVKLYASNRYLLFFTAQILSALGNKLHCLKAYV